MPSELARKIALEIKAVMASSHDERWAKLLADVAVIRYQLDDFAGWKAKHEADDAAKFAALSAETRDARDFKHSWKGALALATASLALLIWGLNRLIPVAPARQLAPPAAIVQPANPTEGP